MLNEAKRLHDIGFGIHLLHGESGVKSRAKTPLRSAWATPPREDLQSIRRAYRHGHGLGVALGACSPLGDGAGYLCVVDVDLKSDDPRHAAEAFAVVDAQFPRLRDIAPCVKTGRGFHFYARTATPMQSGKLGASNETVRIYSPSNELNKSQAAQLTQDEIKRHIRVKGAWEVEFMSIGKQVVLPPSKHPDTEQSYEWAVPFEKIEQLPWLDGADFGKVSQRKKQSKDPSKTRAVVKPFTITAVDLISPDCPLSGAMLDLLMLGAGSSGDRSADCFSLTLAMIHANYSDDEIKTVLTDSANALGDVAFGHAKTKDRQRAGVWVQRYCIDKARWLSSAERAFADEVEVTPVLETDDAVHAQLRELTEVTNWQDTLARGGKDGDGPPKPTMDNVLIILRNAVGMGIIKRDTFKNRDFYGVNTPWGGRIGQPITDDDAVRIRAWLASHFRVEPTKDTIFDALTEIALENAFHPARDWFASLPAWDCTPRLDTWLRDYFNAEGDPEYLAQVFRKWMVAAVTRVHRPGVKFDWMIIFEGAQGIGKSSFGRLLFGEEFFLDALPNLNDKDSALALQGTLCVEFGELAGLRKSDLDLVKAYVTRQVDKVRPPYGRKVLEVPRQCVFFGTTNRDEYLRDDTGNRRFMPIKVGELDFDQLARDRDQLFAEALFLFQNGLETSLYLEGAAKAYAEVTQGEKMVVTEADIMAELIEDAKQRQERGDPDSLLGAFNFEKIRILDLFSNTGPLARYRGTVGEQHSAARALRALGYERGLGRSRRMWVL